MSFWQTGHSVLSLLVLGRRKTETLGGLGRVSSVLVSSGLGPDLDKARHYELNLMITMMIEMMAMMMKMTMMMTTMKTMKTMRTMMMMMMMLLAMIP